MRDLHVGQVEGHKGIVATAERTIQHSEAAAAQAGEHVQAAQERLDRLDRGEDVPGGLHRPMTREEFDAVLLAAGLTKADIRYMEVVRELPEGALPIIRDAALAASRRAERSTARALHKHHLRDDSEDEE